MNNFADILAIVAYAAALTIAMLPFAEDFFDSGDLEDPADLPVLLFLDLIARFNRLDQL